ncbi:MAG TPA: Fur family transcriptional regulator [Patescibacteria group bacterium]|nr:Fur family transcriptional regulator [Patescibacteria group bacterium]
MKKGIELFKKNRIRITQQRLLVYRLLEGSRAHPTAEHIYARLKKENPSISLATVYTILELFRTKRLVREVRIKPDRRCFDPVIEPHHHFLCRACGAIFDIDLPPCLMAEKGEAQGHAIEEFQGYFYGVCKMCKARQGRAVRSQRRR